MKISEDFKFRGLIDSVSDEKAIQMLDEKPAKFYVGFDPTAKSLQIGNLAVIITMMRLQKAGHIPFVVMGGATGMIGDPSGKSQERNLLDEETLQNNISGQRKQLERLLDFGSDKNPAVMVNNFDWIGRFSFVEFLRDVGKQFKLAEMLAKESVKARLNSESGISFTEFSYQMLQAYDFAHLHKVHGVTLQVGGSDQWGNITAGIQLTRKLHGNQVYGMTIPLVTDSQGKKFGKSEGGTAIYLDPEISSPYAMYQYLLNTDDQSVITYLKYFTFLSHEEIEALADKTLKAPHERQAQKALAQSVVKMVHGQSGLATAQKATRFFFGEKIEDISDKEIDAIFKDVPSVQSDREILNNGSLIDLLAETPLFKSKGEARRAIRQKGVYLNNMTVSEEDKRLSVQDLASENALIIRKGKKNYCVIRFIPLF